MNLTSQQKEAIYQEIERIKGLDNDAKIFSLESTLCVLTCENCPYKLVHALLEIEKTEKQYCLPVLNKFKMKLDKKDGEQKQFFYRLYWDIIGLSMPNFMTKYKDIKNEIQN